MTHTAKGITDKDFALAKKIEEVVAVAAGQGGRRARRHAARATCVLLISNTIERAAAPSKAAPPGVHGPAKFV